MQDLYAGRLLCSRICHDLITPVGAIMSGLELLEESSGENGEVMDLLRLSAQEASRRLMLLRFAFGIGAASQLASLNEIEKTFANAVDPKKHTFSLEFPQGFMADQALLKEWAQLLANLFSVSLEALPYGGKITISGTNGDEPQVKVTLSGRLVTLHNDVKDIMQHSHSQDELSPRTIQAYLVSNLASQVARRIKVTQEGEDCILQTMKA